MNEKSSEKFPWLRLIVAGAATWIFAGFLSYELGPPIWETMLAIAAVCGALGLWTLSRSGEPTMRVRVLLSMAGLMAAIAVVNVLQLLTQ